MLIISSLASSLFEFSSGTTTSSTSDIISSLTGEGIWGSEILESVVVLVSIRGGSPGRITSVVVVDSVVVVELPPNTGSIIESVEDADASIITSVVEAIMSTVAIKDATETPGTKNVRETLAVSL